MEKSQREWMRQKISVDPRSAIDLLTSGDYIASDPDVWFHLGLAEFMLKDYGKAERRFQECLDLGRNTATVWFYFGWALEKQSRPSEALSAYRASLSLDPNMKGSREGLARLAAKYGGLGSKNQSTSFPANNTKDTLHFGDGNITLGRGTGAAKEGLPSISAISNRVTWIGAVPPGERASTRPVMPGQAVPSQAVPSQAVPSQAVPSQLPTRGVLGAPPRATTKRGVVGKVRSVRWRGVSFNGQMNAKQALSFRVDIPDAMGNLRRTLQIEIRGFRISGSVEDGDWVELDKVSESGDVKSFINLSTGQHVRTRLL